MPRRGENIYKRQDGRWEGRVLKQDGNYQYIYAKTYKEVKARKRSLQENRGPDKAGISMAGAAGLFEAWILGELRMRIKPSTYESYYRCTMKYIVPFFKCPAIGRLPIGDAAAQFVRQINTSADLSDAYKRKIISIFKTALREILKGSDRLTGVMEGIRLPRADATQIKVFSIREQRLIEDAAIKQGSRYALGILLCFYTGLRLGEVCALKWGDIDLDAGTMSVTKTVSRIKNFDLDAAKTSLIVGRPKSHKSLRKIPLPTFFIQLVGGMQGCDRSDGHYLLTGNLIPPDPRTYQRYFKSILSQAGIADRKFHAIRHTFATRALELGVDIKTLSEILGHAKVSITLDIYAHSLFDQKRIAMEKLNEMHLVTMECIPFAVTNFVPSS